MSDAVVTGEPQSTRSWLHIQSGTQHDISGSGPLGNGEQHQLLDLRVASSTRDTDHGQMEDSQPVMASGQVLVLSTNGFATEHAKTLSFVAQNFSMVCFNLMLSPTRS